MDIDIDGVLSVGNLRPNWSDIRDGILPFPDIYAEEQYMNLQNARLNSAVFPEFEQPSDEMSMFLAQCSRRELLQQEGDNFQEYFEAPATNSSEEYLQWLETEGLNVVEAMHDRSLRNVTNLVQASGTLLKLADELDFLRPHNDSHLAAHHVINVDLWRVYWRALIAEMRTVEEQCSPELRNSGVFVLTTSPYNEFLRLLAGRLLAEAISVIYENEN